MSPKNAYSPRLKGALLALMATLFLTACMSEDDKRVSVDPESLGTGTGEVFHGAEWATIKNLDPRGEQCIECHGKNNDMSPYSNSMAHNIGLQKNDTPESLGLANLKITGVNIKVDADEGIVEVNLSESMPADANFNLVFAKLAPRVRHSRGHDWQNYLNAPSARSESDSNAVIPIGVAPQRAQGEFVTVSSDRKTLSFDMKDGYGWGAHEFVVTDNDNAAHQFSEFVGTKVHIPDLKEHTSCYAAHEDSHQYPDDNGDKIICWWPDGSHLPAGVYVSDDHHLFISYDEGYTHRVGLALRGGDPAFNTWFDFIPDQPEVVIDENWHKKYNDEFLATTWRDGNNPSAADAQESSVEFQKKPASREIVDIQSCNSCHDNLTRHGDRSEAQLCVTCHNPGNLEPRSGRSIDLKHMVHRIHRGNSLPTEDSETVANRDDIASKENAKGGKGLLGKLATDWTKVRFPQGPTPGHKDGITNCVKCHMGPETLNQVNDMAATLGAGQNYDAQKELKLAKVTPQGDNWLGVRSIEACRGCHDSVIWARGEDGNRGPAVLEDMMKAVPLYSDKYLGIGYDFIGRENNGDHANVTIGTSGAANGDQFTCGAAGGCHSNLNPKFDLGKLSGASFGTGAGNTVQANHLKLTRNFILAERFKTEITNPKIENGIFSATVKILDKKINNYLKITADRKVTPDGLDEQTANLSGQLGWMHNSPDYNHSPGGGIPGNPLAVSVAWDGSADGVATADLSGMEREVEWNKIKDNLEDVVGTVFIQASMGTYRPQTATLDFRFDNSPLASTEGRRKVVDFTAGNGVVNADSVDGWDKHDGANTQSCSSCHLQLAYHGSRTNNVQACIVCHNPQRTDVNTGTRRGELSELDGQYEESLDFKRLIHAVHSASNKRIDPLYVGTANSRPSQEGDAVRGHSFPGVISNCKSCHIEDENSGKWTFDLEQLPEGMIGSTAITADWASIGNYATEGAVRHDFDGTDPASPASHKGHMKMTPIASVCSSCHDAGYKTSDGRMNPDIIDGGPYVGSHWWQMGGIAPGIVRPGDSPQSTKHQSGK